MCNYEIYRGQSPFQSALDQISTATGIPKEILMGDQINIQWIETDYEWYCRDREMAGHRRISKENYIWFFETNPDQVRPHNMQELWRSPSSLDSDMNWRKNHG